MKIVFFIDHLRPDGTQHVLKQLVEGFGKRGHQQLIICLNDSWDDVLKKKLLDTGADVRIVGKHALTLGYGFIYIWNWLRQGYFDVAVTMLFVSDVVGRAMAHVAGVPLIVSSIQTRDEFYSRWQRWLVRRTMRWADVVELCSENIRDFAIKEEGAPSERICVIQHSIRVDDYNLSNTRESILNEFGLPADGILIGYVGRLTYQKSHDILFQALVYLNRKDFHVIIAGTGEELDNLTELATKLNLNKNIHFAGHRRDVPRLLNGFDLYVHPSRYEGMPIAVLEAMASGCPIVATAVDGTKELIIDGVHGWLVPPEDPKALAQSIEAAINDPIEAKRRARLARKRVSTHFNQESMITAWEDLLVDNLV